jgi:two-component system, OmpR family, KDP operon response regulator KdpE
VTGPADAPHLLLVDDDPRLLMLLGDKLRRDGLIVECARTGRAALQSFEERWPDIVILDTVLSDMSGHDLAERIKARGDVPILVLSAETEVEQKAESLLGHAEDYVTKPFHYPELFARVQRILHRVQDRIPSQELVLGPELTIQLSRGRALIGEREVRLSPTESRVLAVLASRVGSPVTTQELLARVWRLAADADPASVWVTIRRLRQKLETDPDHPRYLVTADAGGYSLLRSETVAV